MDNAKFGSRGFTLIASLLLLLLMSGLALGLLMMVNTEQRVGGYDLNNTYTYHAAEGAIEKMTADLAATFKNIQAPTSAQICNVSSNLPTWDTSVSYPVYKVAPVPFAFGVDPCSSAALATNPTPTTAWGQVASGPDAGLYAQLIPITMNVQVQRGGGESVSMTRTAEVALIPVFQFGVFSDSDLYFGRSPHLGFAGRVHTNGDLYLGVADTYHLVFGDKIAAYGNVIRAVQQQGDPNTDNDQGTVMIPTQAGGCSAQMANLAGATPNTTTCIDIANTTSGLGSTYGSVQGGHASTQNPAWQNVSQTTYQNFIIDGNGPCGVGNVNCPNSTGATNLSLPFVNGTTSAVQVIRRPPAGEDPTSLLGASREANMASIRIILSDTQAGLHLVGWNGVASQDVYLSSMAPTGFPSTAFSSAGIPVGAATNTYYFGEAWCGSPAGSAAGTACANDPNFVVPASYAQTNWGAGTLTAAGTSYTAAYVATHPTLKAGTEWPILGGWLLVEVKWSSDGLWHGVTQEWLKLGFARGVQVPTQPGTTNQTPTSNTLQAYGINYLADHKNAILYLQQTADRNGDATVTAAGDALGNNIFYDVLQGSYSQYNWYPINLYDAREGEVNDTRTNASPYPMAGACGAATCPAPAANVPSGTANGVMNAVELDVGNLKNWLACTNGVGGCTGTSVDFATQNGYVLYFSDRRGMNLAGANPVANQGEYGFEDTINYANRAAGFVPDGVLDPANYNTVRPEDVNGNGVLDTYGAQYVGDAFGVGATAATNNLPRNPYGSRFSTFTIGRANRVTGARHALKLVDGALGNLPTMPPGNAVNNCSYVNADGTANPTGCGGFTIASENPVYIQGNYNSNCPAANPVTCTQTNAGASTNYDPAWTGGAEPNHAAASIIADAVTVLSNNWQDAGCAPSGGTCTATLNQTTGSLYNAVNTPLGQLAAAAATPNRIALTTYYRVAIAGGKNIAFTNTLLVPEFGYGTDGGVHNFLRFLEDWGGVPAAYYGGTHTANQQLYYKGSLVSLYWAQYATGPFKCCDLVYNPPDRQYTFDNLFSVPANLPPGTPMFRNVDNLTYRQNQVARTN